MICTVKEIQNNSVFGILERVFDAPTVGYIVVDLDKKLIYFSLHKRKDVFCSNKVKFLEIDEANMFMRSYQEDLEMSAHRLQSGQIEWHLRNLDLLNKAVEDYHNCFEELKRFV